MSSTAGPADEFHPPVASPCPRSSAAVRVRGVASSRPRRAGDGPPRPVGHPTRRGGDRRRGVVRAGLLPRPGPCVPVGDAVAGRPRDARRTGRAGGAAGGPDKPAGRLPPGGRASGGSATRRREGSPRRVHGRDQRRDDGRVAAQAARVRAPEGPPDPVGAGRRAGVPGAPVVRAGVELGRGVGPAADAPGRRAGRGTGVGPAGRTTPPPDPLPRAGRGKRFCLPSPERGGVASGPPGRRPGALSASRTAWRRVEQLGHRGKPDRVRQTALGERPAPARDRAADLVSGARHDAGVVGRRGDDDRDAGVRGRAQRVRLLGRDRRADRQLRPVPRTQPRRRDGPRGDPHQGPAGRGRGRAHHATRAGDFAADRGNVGRRVPAGGVARRPAGARAIGCAAGAGLRDVPPGVRVLAGAAAERRLRRLVGDDRLAAHRAVAGPPWPQRAVPGPGRRAGSGLGGGVVAIRADAVRREPAGRVRGHGEQRSGA